VAVTSEVRKRHAAGLGARRDDEPGRVAEDATLTAPGSARSPGSSPWLSPPLRRSPAVYGVAIVAVLTLVIGLVVLLAGRWWPPSEWADASWTDRAV